MPKRLGKFELPSKLTKVEEGATSTYAKFVAEPFEAGYGHTVGNSLRRVLLSSLEGAAISSHQDRRAPSTNSQSIAGRRRGRDRHRPQPEEDPVQSPTSARRSRSFLNADKEGAVTAADIQLDAGIEILNPDQVICTLDKKRASRPSSRSRSAAATARGEENKQAEQPIGVIAIDSLFSPVRKVKYAVENTRVGQTHRLRQADPRDLDRRAHHARRRAAAVRRDPQAITSTSSPTSTRSRSSSRASQQQVSQEKNKLKKLLNMSVNEIELSVRAANCLNNANITTVGQLAMKTEAEMLKYRNFGKKSLNEIKDKLEALGLSLGMKFDERLLDAKKEA